MLAQEAYSQFRYADVKPILDTHCVKCHKPSGDASFMPFTSFEEIKGNHEYMRDALAFGIMPQDNPTFNATADGQKLLSWLKEGPDLYGTSIPDTCPIPEPKPEPIIRKDPRDLTYTDLKPIIDRNCVGCHNPQGQMRKRPFTTLAEIKRNAKRMWDRLDEGKMPLNKPEWRFTEEGRTLIGWLRYGRDVNQATPRDDDDAIRYHFSKPTLGSMRSTNPVLRLMWQSIQMEGADSMPAGNSDSSTRPPFGS